MGERKERGKKIECSRERRRREIEEEREKSSGGMVIEECSVVAVGAVDALSTVFLNHFV